MRAQVSELRLAPVGMGLHGRRLSTVLGVTVGITAGLLVALAGPSVAVLTVLGVTALAVTVWMPGVLLGAYLMIPFFKGAVQPYLPIDATVVLAVLNMLQVIPVALDSRRRARSRLGIVLWVGLACLVLGGVLYAPNQDLALGRAINFWALVFVPLPPAAIRVARSERFVRQLVWTLLVMGVVTTLLGLMAAFGPQRLVVLDMNTIQTARAALLVPVVGVAFVMQEPARLARVAVAILIPCAILVALASGARGPMLMLLLLGAIGLVRSVAGVSLADRRIAGVIAGLAVLSIGLVSVFGGDLPQTSAARLGGLGAALEAGLMGTDVAHESRMSLYGLAINLFAQHPVLGTGTAGFEFLSPYALGRDAAAVYPHNAVLQFGAEYGMVGAATFLAIVMLGLARRVPAGSAWAAIRATFLFFLLNAMVSGNILEDRTTWGLLLLLLFAEAIVLARPGSARQGRLDDLANAAHVGGRVPAIAVDGQHTTAQLPPGVTH